MYCIYPSFREVEWRGLCSDGFPPAGGSRKGADCWNALLALLALRAKLLAGFYGTQIRKKMWKCGNVINV